MNTKERIFNFLSFGTVFYLDRFSSEWSGWGSSDSDWGSSNDW